MGGSIRTIDGYKYAVGLFYKHAGIKDHSEFLALSSSDVEEKIYQWIDLLKYKTQCTEKSKDWKESPFSPNPIKNYLKSIKKFLEMLEVDFRKTRKYDRKNGMNYSENNV